MSFCAITGKNYGRGDFSYLTRTDKFCVDCKHHNKMKERNCYNEIRRKGKKFFQCEEWEEMAK